MRIIASDGSGWTEQGLEGLPFEHVSASFDNRCPTWEEMCLVKQMFWDENEIVIQYHPPKKSYANLHPYCLHLWKPIDFEFPLPPMLTLVPG